MSGRSGSVRERLRVTRTALCAVTAAILVASGCGGSTEGTVDSGDEGFPSAAPATATAAGSTATTATAYPTRRDLGMELDLEQRVFTIDGVTGAAPEGWEDPHIRAFYVFLAYNTAKQPPEVNWLSVDGPTWAGIGPPGPVPLPEPLPPDIPRPAR